MYGERANSNSAHESCPRRSAGVSPVADSSWAAPSGRRDGSAMADVKVARVEAVGGYRDEPRYPPAEGEPSEVDLHPQSVLRRRSRVVERSVVLDAGDVMLVRDVGAPEHRRPTARVGAERQLRIDEVALLERDLRIRPERCLRFVLVCEIHSGSERVLAELDVVGEADIPRELGRERNLGAREVDDVVRDAVSIAVPSGAERIPDVAERAQLAFHVRQAEVERQVAEPRLTAELDSPDGALGLRVSESRIIQAWKRGFEFGKVRLVVVEGLVVDAELGVELVIGQARLPSGLVVDDLHWVVFDEHRDGGAFWERREDIDAAAHVSARDEAIEIVHGADVPVDRYLP